MEASQKAECPFVLEQLAEHYRVGQPLGLYQLPQLRIRLLQITKTVLLVAVICGLCVIVVEGAFFSMPIGRCPIRMRQWC